VTVGRGVALLLLLVGLALVKIHFRAEQMKSSGRIQAFREERTELRRQSWALQLELARLRAPDRVLDRAERWRLEVRAPWPVDLTDVDGHPLVKR